ncbi:protein C17H12.2 [Aphelenchoides avenae]|nr:protein C17H12.2 [Aphelenchus avenae]
MNTFELKRALRRFLDAGASRNFSRKAVLVTGGLLFIFVYFFLSSSSTPKPTAVQTCVADHFSQKSVENFDPLAQRPEIAFVGNGYIGLDVSTDRQLLLATDANKILSVFTSFRPLVDLKLPFSNGEKFHFVSDFDEGTSKSVHCSIVAEKCVCVYQSVYAHRTRPNVLIQDIKVSNPSTSTLDVGLSRTVPFDWEKQDSGAVPVYTKLFSENTKFAVAVVCSSTPTTPATIRQQTEESFRFICVVDHEAASGQDSDAMVKRRAATKVLHRFNSVNAVNSNQLDNEHKDAWTVLDKPSFNLSFSKAPNAVNSEQVNHMKYALLSNLRAPLFEANTNRPFYEQLLTQNELCYSGHTTLLTPSKLWQSWTSVNDMLKTVEIWIMTLEHRGCIHLLRAGAHGAAQAFLLSLSAGTFTHERLEFTLDPETDIHRNLHIDGLEFGPAKLSLDFELDPAYRPFMRLSSSGPLYVCTAGCLDPPQLLSKTPVQLNIKVTKPPTPILFVAADKAQLEQLGSTLHVMDAPAHEAHKIAIHEHGSSGGLPTLFWVVLVFLLVAFHLFLFKLLYTEWQNASSVPYSKFTKKMLLKR